MIVNQDLLEKLHAAKEAKYLSYQEIVDRTEENGEAVSLSTVKRVFQKGADLTGFRYNQTIRPIVRVVLGLDEETEAPKPESDPQQAEQYYTTIEAMKSVIDFKHQQVTDLTAENTRLREDLNAARGSNQNSVEKVETDAQKKIDYLKKIVEDLQNASRWYKKLILILCSFVALVLLALILDLCIGHIGWVRY